MKTSLDGAKWWQIAYAAPAVALFGYFLFRKLRRLLGLGRRAVDKINSTVDEEQPEQD